MPADTTPATRRVLIVGLLLFSLAGIITFLILTFMPFADAMGGCGGG